MTALDAETAKPAAAHTAPAARTREVWRGLACTRLTLPCGDSALVADLGAQVLSWTVQGREQLFISPRAVVDGSAALRGGIPVCFPQFNQRGPLPKHGLVRTQYWTQVSAPADDGAPAADSVCAQWLLRDNVHTRVHWPYAFEARVQVQLYPDMLRVELGAENTGQEPWAFTAALHTYVRAQQVADATLHGLHGRAYWDAADGFAPRVQTGAVNFGAEVDRVYPRAAAPLQLQGAQPSGLFIAQDAAWGETVVWNPGPKLCAALVDMEPGSWQHMLCVEAAQINQPVAVQPGGRWMGAQVLTVA